MSTSLYVRARLALAVAGRESADLSRGIVGDVSTPMPPGERIRKARRLRLMSLSVVDRAVLAELSEGASWETVGEALGIGAGEAERRYAPTWEQWASGDQDTDLDFGDYGIGLTGDPDLVGTAATLDAWYNRHKDLWDDPAEEHPVGRVLTDDRP